MQDFTSPTQVMVEVAEGTQHTWDQQSSALLGPLGVLDTCSQLEGNWGQGGYAGFWEGTQTPLHLLSPHQAKQLLEIPPKNPEQHLGRREPREKCSRVNSMGNWRLSPPPHQRKQTPQDPSTATNTHRVILGGMQSKAAPQPHPDPLQYLLPGRAVPQGPCQHIPHDARVPVLALPAAPSGAKHIWQGRVGHPGFVPTRGG